MRKKTFRERVKFYLRIRWRAFRRRPLVFLRYLFTILFFPVAGDYHLSVFDGYTAAAQSFVAKYV